MPQSDPRIVYGIHSMTPYNRTTKQPYGALKVIGSAALSLSADLESLYAGSNKYPWAVESKTVSTEVTAKVKAYPGFLFELFLGAVNTEAGSDTAGTISTLTNRNGSTAMSATIGVASVTVLTASKANLKFGKYVIKVLTSTTIALFAYSDVDFSRGTAGVFLDDTLQLGSAITITTGANSDVAGYGLRFTGGSGTIGMTVGDTATFEVLPPSSKSANIVVGASGSTFPAFGCVFVAQKRATQEMFEIDAHNCVAAGFPISLEENAFSQPEVKITCFYDSTLDRVFTIRTVNPT